MIDSQRLAYFVAVAETGSIRGAAQLLHLTPAALSRAVKVLEIEVGAVLVAPKGRGIVLTDAGRRLARRAQPILQSLAELHSVADDETERSVLRYGSHETWGTYFASELVACTGREVDIEHRYLRPGELEQALLRKEIDAGISYLAQPRMGTHTIPAGTIAMGVFGRPGLADVAFDELEFAVPVGPVIDSVGQSQSLDGWPDPRHARRVRYRVSHTETALEHARMGRCVAYFARFIVELHNRRAMAHRRLVMIDAPQIIAEHRQPVYLVVRDGEVDTAAAQWLLAAIKRVTDQDHG